VDRFEAAAGQVSYKGYVGDEVQVEFPGDTSYILLRSDLVTSMSSVDAAKQQKAEDTELEAIIGKPEDMGSFDMPNPKGYL